MSENNDLNKRLMYMGAGLQGLTPTTIFIDDKPLNTISSLTLKETKNILTDSSNDVNDAFKGTIIIDSCHYDYLGPDAIDYERYDLRCSRDGQRCSWKDKIPAYINLKQYRQNIVGYNNQYRGNLVVKNTKKYYKERKVNRRRQKNRV